VKARLERAILGVVMSLAAFLLDRRLRALQKR
jgi:predicted membrane-bound mannosyltransferase